MRRLVKAFGGELPAGAVFITSDADTFPSRAQVAQLKYCRPAAQLPMLLQHQGYYFTLATAPKHERKYQIVAFTAADLEGPGCQSASTGAAAGLAGRCRMPWHSADSMHQKHPNWPHLSANPGYSLNRFLGPFADLFKDCSIAEAGKGMHFSGHYYTTAVVAQPWIARYWSVCGLRTCCALNDATKNKRRVTTTTYSSGPWLMLQNPAAFGEYMPTAHEVRHCHLLYGDGLKTSAGRAQVLGAAAEACSHVQL